MSTPPPSPTTTITIEPWLADVLRRQTLVTQKVNHHAFARLRDLAPDAQFALAGIYRDAFVVMEAIGWESDPDSGPVDVPLTAGHIEQLYRRRYDLGATNFARLDALAEAATPRSPRRSAPTSRPTALPARRSIASLRSTTAPPARSAGDCRDRAGRALRSPSAEGTRPISDRGKEALFSILYPRLPGCAFLDLFGGVGAPASRR